MGYSVREPFEDFVRKYVLMFTTAGHHNQPENINCLSPHPAPQQLQIVDLLALLVLLYFILFSPPIRCFPYFFFPFSSLFLSHFCFFSLYPFFSFNILIASLLRASTDMLRFTSAIMRD
jgi:hypothetical protein